MFLHHVHGYWSALSRLVWGAIEPLSFGSLLFQKDWSLLQATLSPLLILLGFYSSGYWLAGFQYDSVLPLTRYQFTLVYVIIWIWSLSFYKKQVQEINQAY